MAKNSKLILGIFFPLLLTTSSSFAAPPNDMFADCIVLVGTNVTVAANNSLATLEPGEVAGADGHTVWYAWAAPFAARVRITSSACCFNRAFTVYTGPSIEHLLRVASDQNSLTFMAEEGGVYRLQADGGNGGDFTITFEATPLVPATNDAFNDSILLKGGHLTDGACINYATLQFGEPAHRDGAPCKSLWWRWQAPCNGLALFGTSASLATNVMIAAYTGSSIELLTLKKKSIGVLELPVVGGTVYHIAAVVDELTLGDVVFNLNHTDGNFTPSISVPGNRLCEPSFEGTGLELTCWHVTLGIGGYVGEPGGADGTTWPVIDGGGTIWQEFATVPGHVYEVRFAFRPEFGFSNGSAHVLWDSQDLGLADSPAADGAYWHWTNFTALATNTTSRLTLTTEGRLGLDAFSVVDVTAPPNIVKQPAPLSIVAGGTAAFIVGASGSSPLSYQWFFNNSVLANRTNFVLTLSSVTTNDAGDYRVIITNNFGAITSHVAALAVDAPLDATILAQPYGDTVPVGGYYNLSVVAAGTPPITYQWFKNDSEILDATNRNLTFTNVQPTDAGAYQVLVQNPAGSVSSLSAILVVSTNAVGGGEINFRNKFTFGFSNAAPVFEMDGFTPLSGSQYVAQLYSGPSLDLLRPAGQATPFQNGFDAGFFVPQIVTLPNVVAGSNAVLQVRVWDSSWATSYEEARARGEKFGKSAVLELIAGGGALPPPQMLDLESFSLQAGLPFFTVGVISLLELQPDGDIVWSLQGESGFRYLIEKNGEGSQWRPFVIVTNATGTVTFSDSATNISSVVLYRSRILD